MSEKSPIKNKTIISSSNFQKFEDGENIIPQIQLKLISSMMNDNQFTAQLIKAEPPKTEEQLLDKLEQITSIKYELLTPFLGYTEQSPHLLISKYQEEDTLRSEESNESINEDDSFLTHIFHQNQNDPSIDWLNGTSKSIIALCVSKAMMVLHENNIIHGNLQPKTIKIIGSSHLPHLIDYGLNEFRGKPRESTPHRYLAPELKKATDYSKKTDVFAFGLLLCELLKGKSYRKPTEEPNNIRSAPKKLRKLIVQCFSQNPEDRPTFSEIYGQIKAHEALFYETDEDELDRIIKALDEIDYVRNNTKFKSLAELDSENISDLYQLAKDVNPFNAENFFNIIGNKFDRNTEYKLFKAMLDVSLRFVQDPVYCKIFVNTQVHLNLPFDNERLYKQVFDIVYWIAKYEPEAIADICDSLVYIMPNPKYTKKILVILTCYQQTACYDKKFCTVQKLWTFLDQVLTTLYNKKNIKYQSNFISVFYTLCKNVPFYKKGRLKVCIKIFTSLIDSTNHSTIRAIYAFLSEYKDEPIPDENAARFYRYTNKHLVNPHTALAAVKFLLIKQKFKISKDLVTSAIRLASISHLGNLLLCKIAESEKGSALLMKKLDFIELPLPDLEGTLRVLLILIRKKKMNLEAYRNSESLPFFISNLSKNADLRTIRIIQNLLLIIKCDAKFINELEENNFCREFWSSMERTGDEQTMKNTLNIFKLFACKCPHLDFFKDLIKALRVRITLNNQDPDSSLDLLFEILTLFALLSSIPNCIPLFKDFVVEDEFRKISKNDPEAREYIEPLKKNIEAYNSRERKVKKRAKSVPKSQKRRDTI